MINSTQYKQAQKVQRLYELQKKKEKVGKLFSYMGGVIKIVDIKDFGYTVIGYEDLFNKIPRLNMTTVSENVLRDNCKEISKKEFDKVANKVMEKLGVKPKK